MLKKLDLAINSHHDYALLASTLALVSLGLTMVFISSTVMASSQYQDPYFFVKRQTLIRPGRHRRPGPGPLHRLPPL